MIGHVGKYLKKDLFQLIFFVTNRCNSRCSFCFNWKNLNNLKEKELSIDEIKKISSSMPNFPWLMISGGEPFLRDDLARIIEIFYKQNKISHLTIPTNAILSNKVKEVTEKILEKCPKISMTLALSLDNLKEKHDELRGVAGNFDKVIETIGLMKSTRQKYKNLSVKINTVVATHNYKDLDKIIEFVKTLGVDMHSLDFIRGDPFDKSAKLPPTDELPAILRRIRKVYEYYGGYKSLKKHNMIFEKLSKSAILRNYEIFFETVKKNAQVIKCYAGNVNAVMSPYGDISFCEMLQPIGNIKDLDYDFKKIWNSEKAKKLREFVKNKGCHCYHPCYVLTNILFNPKELMKLMIR